MSIAYVEPQDLSTSSIAEIFKRGASAIVLHNDARIEKLWSQLVAFSRDSSSNEDAEVLPWDGSILDLEKNFVPGLNLADEVGDSFHARPGHLTYIARKIALEQTPGSSEVSCSPAAFYAGRKKYSLNPRVLQLAFQVAGDVIASLSAPNDGGHVAIHRLRYVSDLDELGRRIALVAKAFGGKSAIGVLHRLEAGPGTSEYLTSLLRRSRLLARAAALAPSCLMRALGLRVASRSDELVILGNAHTDSRLFSGLIADRSNVHTEMWADRRWQRLPIARDQMVILPGRKAQRMLGIKPTWHRIVLTQGVSSGSDHGETTLLIGAS